MCSKIVVVVLHGKFPSSAAVAYWLGEWVMGGEGHGFISGRIEWGVHILNSCLWPKSPSASRASNPTLLQRLIQVPYTSSKKMKNIQLSVANMCVRTDITRKCCVDIIPRTAIIWVAGLLNVGLHFFVNGSSDKATLMSSSLSFLCCQWLCMSICVIAVRYVGYSI